MVYQIELSPRAWRDFKKLPAQIRKRIESHIDALAPDPRPHGVVKLSGEENLWRIRIGAYRVIYEIHDDRLIVLVVKIAARKEVYR